MAKELAKEADDEAKLRSAISRAYYAAFCTANNYMCNNDNKSIPPNTPVHQFVIKYFKGKPGEGHRHRKRYQIGKDLDRMRIDRVKVDYSFDAGDLRSLSITAQDVLARSDRVISTIENGAN